MAPVAAAGGRILDDRIQKACRLTHGGAALGGGAAVAEQPLEHDARVHFGRQRRGRRPPRHGIRVEAVGAAVAGNRRRALERQLQRRQARVLADRRRSDLIGGRAQPDLQPRAARPGMHAAQPGGGGSMVIRIAVAERLRLAMRQSAHHEHAVAERLERAEDR